MKQASTRRFPFRVVTTFPFRKLFTGKAKKKKKKKEERRKKKKKAKAKEMACVLSSLRDGQRVGGVEVTELSAKGLGLGQEWKDGRVKPRLVCVTRSAAGLGFSVEGGSPAVFVNVDRLGPAYAAGVRDNDQCIIVNSVLVLHLSAASLINLFDTCEDEFIKMLVLQKTEHKPFLPAAVPWWSQPFIDRFGFDTRAEDEGGDNIVIGCCKSSAVTSTTELGAGEEQELEEQQKEEHQEHQEQEEEEEEQQQQQQQQQHTDTRPSPEDQAHGEPFLLLLCSFAPVSKRFGERGGEEQAFFSELGYVIPLCLCLFVCLFACLFCCVASPSQSKFGTHL